MCPCRIYYFSQAGRHWVCAHAEFITFGRTGGIGCVHMQNLLLLDRTEGIGCVPMQNLLVLAELKALDVCPCKIYCLRLAGRHWVCAHAKFVTFGTTKGIGCVPMQNLLLLAELKALGCVPMQNVILLAQLKALDVCLCKIYCFW